MAANRGADLRVRITADLDDIKRGLGLLRGDLAQVKKDAAQARPDAKAWEASIGRIRGAVASLVGAYVGVQTVTRGVGALFDAVGRADQLDKMSQSAGISVEVLSRLDYAARLSGTNINELSRGLLKLSQDATKNQGVLGQLGIEITDAAGQARTADALLLDLADVFAALPDGAEKTALAMRLLGEDAGPRLVPLLNAGRAGIEALGIEAERTGNAMDTEAARAAVELGDNIDRLKLQVTGLANETAKRLIPAMSAYAEQAAGAGKQSSVAARGGQVLSVVLKGLATPVIVVKNLLEAMVNQMLFVGTTAAKIGGLLAKTFGGGLMGAGRALRDLATGRATVGEVYDRLRGGIRGVGEDSAETLRGIRAGFSAMKTGLVEAGRDIANLSALFDSAAQKSADGMRETGQAADDAAAGADALLKRLQELLAGTGSGGGGSGTEDQIKRLAASTVVLQDEIKRAQAALDQQFEAGGIGVGAYYAQRVANQQRLIDLQVAQLESELALTQELDRRRRIEEQLTILERTRAQVAVDGARERAEAEAAQKAARGAELRAQSGGITGRLSAQEQSISAQVAAGSLGYLEGERRLDEIRGAALANLRALRQEQADYLASLAPGDPNLAAAQDGLLGLDTAIANVQASMQELRQGTMDAGVSSLTAFFTNLREGALSAGEAFRELVADFTRGLYDMLAQATAERLVGAISGLFSGGGAGPGGDGASVQQGASQLTVAAAATSVAGGAISAGATQLSVSAGQLTAAAAALAAANAVGGVATFGLAHGGGVAGDLHMSRGGINPLVFGAAPRYHGGGVAGLKSGEIPAILQRGETIRTRQQEAALGDRMAAGQPQPTPIRNIIVFSDDELASALSGPAAERVVVSHVRRNQGVLDG